MGSDGVLAEVMLGIGFLALWLTMAGYCYNRVSLLDSHIWKGKKLKSREYEEIEINVANKVTRFANGVNKESVRKLELAAFLYDTIQISFFVFSAAAHPWSPKNEWAEFIIYFIRLFCLDLPVDLMIPLFAIYLVLLGTFLLLSIFYSYTKNSENVTTQRMNASVSVIASMDRHAPEVMNFFFNSLFLTFCRFSFKFLSCASFTNMKAGTFLVDDFYGNFKCWSRMGDLPFLLFVLALLVLMLFVSLSWAYRRGVWVAALPCTERFSCMIILAKFFLCGSLVIFVTQPEVTIAFTLAMWIVLAYNVVTTIPFLTSGTQSLHYNAYYFGSLMLGAYFSVCYLLLSLYEHGQWGLLYFVGAIFMLIVPIITVTNFLQKFRGEVFALRSKAFARQLLLCIMYGDMLRVCVNYLVENFCNDQTTSKYVLDIIEKEFSEDQRSFLTAFSPAKLPFLEWWYKWELNHPKPGAIHRIILHKIFVNNSVPKLFDLCCYQIVKMDEDTWRSTNQLSDDVKEYIEELCSPVSSVDFKDVLKHKHKNKIRRRESNGDRLTITVHALGEI